MFKNRISSKTKHNSHNNVVIFKVNRVIKMYNVVGHSTVKVTTCTFHESERDVETEIVQACVQCYYLICCYLF
jgi:hypothetical protein